MDRRDFLKKSALGIAGAVVGAGLIGSLGTTATGCAPAGKRIGLQLWSVREAMGKDPEATLKLLSEIGYQELETASYDKGMIYGLSPADFKALCDKYKLKVTSCHIGGGQGWDPAREAELMAWWDKAIEDHKMLGCRWIVMPSSYPAETVEGEKGARAICDYFNKIGAKVKAAGLEGFGYHNHNFEFRPLDNGQLWWEYLAENTSADVALEMDVYWVIQGGGDPVAYLNKYAGKFPLLHIKDDDIIGDSGKIEFGPIFEAAYAQGMKNFYVEVERYPLPAEICVEKSFDFLNAAEYVKK